MEICKACGFCSGYCAVFPAIAMRRAFSNADVAYIANLCHDCRGCLDACQYAPPHEFAVNLPQRFSAVRRETYEAYAVPRQGQYLVAHNLSVIPLAFVAAVTLAVMLPWNLVVALAGVLFVLSIASATVSARRFWNDIAKVAPAATMVRALWRATGDVVTLRNLSGVRKYFHYAVLGGFLLACASTIAVRFSASVSLATWLGVVGGSGMTIGGAGLLLAKAFSDARPRAQHLLGFEYAFVLLVVLVAGSGLALHAFLASPVLRYLLPIHLGIVLTVFFVWPYSKFVHGIYRGLALLRSAMEEKPAA